MNHETQPVVACQDCGDLVQVKRAYFTGVDGRAMTDARCYRCHEDAVRKAARVPQPGEQKIIPRR
jgi:hypothetical protein